MTLKKSYTTTTTTTTDAAAADVPDDLFFYFFFRVVKLYTNTYTHTDTKRLTQIYLLLRNAIVLSFAALTTRFKGIASVFYTSIKETVLSVRVLVALQAIETNTHTYKHEHTQRFAFGRTIDKDDKRFTGEFHSI